MKRAQVFEKITESGIVAVIRAESEEKGRRIVDAVIKGGISVIEVTMTVPGAVDIIKELAAAHRGQDVLIGAGTVLDPETARACILAGAQFIVSPSFNADTVRLCNRYAVAAIPGVMTIREAVGALELGAEILKVFPGSAFGPKIIGAFKGPLPQADFMPTGGVTLANAAEWIRGGAVAVGTGSDLTRGAKTGDYALVAETAAQFVRAVQAAKSERKK